MAHLVVSPLHHFTPYISVLVTPLLRYSYRAKHEEQRIERTSSCLSMNSMEVWRMEGLPTVQEE